MEFRFESPLKLAKLSADRVFTESEFHTVGGIDAILTNSN